MEDKILTQKNSIYGGIADKTEYHIERSHQFGKHFEQRYKCVTDFTQSQTSQIQCTLFVKVYLQFYVNEIDLIKLVIQMIIRGMF